MAKKNPTDSIPAPVSPSQVELDTQIAQFRERLKASCQESLSRANKDTSWFCKFFSRDNLIGAFFFAMVWLAGGFFRIWQIKNQCLKDCLNSDLLLFMGLLLLLLFAFIWALNAPWKVSRNVPKLQEFMLISILLILEFAGVALCVRLEFIPTDKPWQIITAMPLAFLPALLVNILDSRTAICTAILETVLLPLQLTGTAEEAHYRIFCFALMIALLAIPFFRNLGNRAQYLIRGLLFSIVIITIGLMFYFMEENVALPSKDLSVKDCLRELLGEPLSQVAIRGLCQGVATGILCMIFQTFFELSFHLLTPLVLGEMTDVNAPLLQRLRHEAPGTYQHSLDVAELGTNAASLIGADARLVHVMGLYHDVGKLFAPQYFAENMHDGQNPLEGSLRPEESAELIFEHTNHGIQLAKKYGLSQFIVPAIRQHHGNTMLEHFYRKACDLAKANGTAAPTPASFRYPQEPMTSREVAILSLADSCEAGIRALLSITPDLASLSQKIVNETQDAKEQAPAKCEKILTESFGKRDTSAVIQAIDKRIADIILKRVADHQLDKVDLTTRELALIARSFRETILFHFHTRPEYRQK